MADKEKRKSREREKYDIDKLISHIDKNSIDMEPLDYNAEKMAIFATNVNLKRHICEIRDGLKPVQRRILLVMYEQRLINKTTKSAQIIGDLNKKYHQMWVALY